MSLCVVEVVENTYICLENLENYFTSCTNGRIVENYLFVFFNSIFNFCMQLQLWTRLRVRPRRKLWPRLRLRLRPRRRLRLRLMLLALILRRT
jgi:hypothetical protein